jgi:hypothetical protein
MLQRMSYRLENRRLYIADLARRQFEMETGRGPMQPLAYRVLSKRLREALAGLPEPTARTGFAELAPQLIPLVAETIETRHFNDHGCLFGAAAVHCRDEAEMLIDRLKRPSAGTA